MKNNISENNQNELDLLKNWCLTIVNFLIELDGESPIFSELKSVINKSYDVKNLKALRHCKKDINEWARGIPIQETSKLNILLLEKFGESLEVSKRKIELILKKGKINSQEEYNILLNKVEDIYDKDGKENEIETLNKLLAQYEKNKK